MAARLRSRALFPSCLGPTDQAEGSEESARSSMTEQRRRCAVCGKLTYKWQRVNGGPWHCYDQCRSTTERGVA